MNRTLGFDKIYVINLAKRKDRKESLLKKFKDLDLTFIEAVDGKKLDIEQNLKDKIFNKTFYDPAGICTKGVYGCALSHKKAWDQAIEDNVETALFLEDDVKIIESELQKYQSIYEDLKLVEWDLVHLGKKKTEIYGINVSKHLTVPRFNSNHNGAHAYVCTKSFIKTLSDNYLPIRYAADVYLEQFYKTHNLFTLRKSLFMQDTDNLDPSKSDSDTFYNEIRNNNHPGIEFSNEGVVTNKKIVKYITHPDDILNQYVECNIEEPKFGEQLFKSNCKPNEKLFAIFDLLKYLKHKNITGNMLELNAYMGEKTFFFSSSNLFNYIYAHNDYERELKYNIDNGISSKEVEIGFNNNNFLLRKKIIQINDIQKYNNINFIFINNLYKEDIKNILTSLKPILNKGVYLAGDNIDDLKKMKLKSKKTFNKNLWIGRL